MQLYHEAYVLDVHAGVSSFLPEELGTYATYKRGKNLENTRIFPCHAIASH